MTEKKPGRPKVPPEKKKKTRAIVLDDQQFSELERLAEEKQMNRSEYIIYKCNLNRSV